MCTQDASMKGKIDSYRVVRLESAIASRQLLTSKRSEWSNFRVPGQGVVKVIEIPL